MKTRHLYILIVICISYTSCIRAIKKNRGFYDLEKSEYDYSKAKKQLDELQNGILIVSIPTERHKLSFLRKTNNEEYIIQSESLKKTQLSFYNSMSNFYSFSKYVFIPDSSLVAFTQQNESDHFLTADAQSYTETQIDTSMNYFVLKSRRDYDQLYIYTKENKFPNRPFPYLSTVNKNTNIKAQEYFDKTPIGKDDWVSMAIYIMSKSFQTLEIY